MRVDDDVLEVLSRAQTSGNSMMLIGQLDRKLYAKTNKVIEACGGTWNRKAQAHLFDIDASERIDQIIISGEVEIPKDEFNFFPSPPSVVNRLIDLANIEHGMRVLEPSAGTGAIAFACANAGADVDCYELMEANFNTLSNDKRMQSVRHMDFLVQCPEPSYDRVVMNPPFAKQADIKHVLHAHKFLKSDGLLVSVMSASVLFRDNTITKEFRDFVRKHDGEIESLPDGSFKQSGTMARTVIVILRNK